MTDVVVVRTKEKELIYPGQLQLSSQYSSKDRAVFDTPTKSVRLLPYLIQSMGKESFSSPSRGHVVFF